MNTARHGHAHRRSILAAIALALSLTTVPTISFGSDLPYAARFETDALWPGGAPRDDSLLTRHSVLSARADRNADVAPTEAMPQDPVNRWRGRFCPTTGCTTLSPTRATDVAAFGFVAFGGAWLARRRVPNPS